MEHSISIAFLSKVNFGLFSINLVVSANVEEIVFRVLYEEDSDVHANR